MKSITPEARATHARIFTALFISFIILVTPVLPVMAATARLANDVKSKLPTTDIRPADAGAVIPSEALSPLPLPAPNITATKVDAFPDLNGDGRAEPGETISYTIQVNNTGADDATGVTFSDTVDANTTYVPGSLKVSPLAFADTYFTAQGSPLIVNAPGVLANDTGTPSPSAVPIVAGPTTGGGTVTLNADGSFTYTPAPAFTGADTFSYTVTNGQAPDDTATVTINVDAAPTVVNTTPANGATGVPPNSNITITFSESVNATNASFNIECPAGSGSQAFNLSASPSTTFTLDPVADLPGGNTCTVTVVANQISDTDTNDPPDNMAANYVFTFSLPPNANDDTRNATGNIRIDTSNSGFSVLSNDVGAGLTITAYDATSARGGQVTMNNATGTFTYNPPPGYEGPDSFTYTITGPTGSDTATVNITVTDMIWFIDDSAPSCTTIAAGCGRLTNPFSDLQSFEAINGGATTNGGDVVDPEAGDHIFIYTGNYTGPLTLENSQRVIGQGAISTIPALTGVTPAADSDPLPATGGVNPTITNPSGDGITVAQNNRLHGLTITNTSGTGVLGNNFGTLTVSEHMIVDNTTGIPVSLSNGNLAATFESISSNGATNGIVLNTTTGSFTVSGNGGSCTSAASCTGGAILNSTSGVSLTNASNVSLDRVFIQNSTNSGVKGTGVVNFAFTNGVIDSSGAVLVSDTSNIAFNNQSVGTENNLSGTLTVTNSTLTNAAFHGIDVFNFAGTLSDVNISNNIITSSNSTVTSKGSGIRLNAFGSATTAASVTRANITNNVISNFPSGAGIIAQGGNASIAVGAPPGDFGIAGSATDIVNITGNTIKGFSAVNRMGTNAIVTAVSGRGQGNYNISNNGTLANPITNIAGNVIVNSALGVANVTSTISNNVIVANHQVDFGSPFGISVGSTTASGGTTATLTVGIANNNISQTDSSGIRATAIGGTVSLFITIKDNVVAAPLGVGIANGIRVDAGNAAAGTDTTVCLDILNNTVAGENGQPGIGLRKQGTVATTHDFGIEGLSPSPATAAQTAAFVTGQNPGSVGGTQIISGSNFVSCASAPVAMYMPETNRSNALAQLDDSQSSDSASAVTSAQARSIFSDATAGAVIARASFEEQALASNFSNESAAQMRLSHGRKMSKARTFTGAYASATGHFLNPMPSGETINATIGTLPAGKGVTITFQVTVDTPLPSNVTQVSNQGTIAGGNFPSVLTDDPAVGGTADPTVTLVLQKPDININDGSVAEPASGSANAVFTVALSHAYSQTVTVNFTTAPGGANPATPGSDYTTTSGTLTFNPGETIQSISVPVLADADNLETDETFLVNLTGATNGVIVDSQATGTITVNNTGGTVLISELRTSGPGGPDDDFVEILNATDSDITVPASGWALVKSGATCSDTPVIVATIPSGTVIPARGNYLLTGTAYTLVAYAAGDQTLSANIEDDRNVALFNTADPSDFGTGTRLDAVGFGLNTGNNCDLLREGSNLPAAGGSLSEYSFVRKVDKGETVDHNNNSVDFVVVSTTPGTAVGGNTPILGAPGPERSTSPRGPIPCNAPGTAKFGRAMLDSTQDANSAPNVVRNTTPDIPNNSTFGTIDFRRRFTNNTGAPVTQLRYRIVDMTTSPSPSGTADLRARTSLPTLVAGVNDTVTCGGSAPCSVLVEGTLLETPPLQAMGGGVNSTLAVGTITLGTPLANGSDVKLHFLFGVQQVGDYHIGIVIETLTAGSIGKDIWELNGNTETGNHTDGDCNTAPVANAGADQTLECTGATTSVTLDGSASFDADGDTPLTYEWREGVTVLGTTAVLNTSLPFGPHTITLKVTDPFGAFDEDTVQINIVDTQNPTLNVPANVVTTTGPGATSCGTVVTDAQLGTATASDGCAGALTPTRSGVPAGNFFPVGITTITYTADDGHGHVVQGFQTVTVTDNTPPVVNAPPDQTVPSDPGMCSANVNPGMATATDNCDSSVTITATRSDGQPLNAPYPVGVTTITWKGTDDAGNMGTDTQTITVTDANAPVIVLTSGILKLWPPNHSYNTFNVTQLVASASDLCDSGVNINDVIITKVTSDEVEDGNGDGNTLNDIVIAPNCKSVQLRAERNGDANGRVYKITLQVQDSSGNVATAVRQVIVPITNNGSAIDSGVQYTVNGTCPLP